MSLRLRHVLTIAATMLGCFVWGATSVLANGVDPIDVAEPMSIAAFVSGLVALYAVKKRHDRK